MSGTDQLLNELRVKGVATSRARLSELCRILGTTFDYEIFEEHMWIDKNENTFDYGSTFQVDVVFKK